MNKAINKEQRKRNSQFQIIIDSNNNDSESSFNSLIALNQNNGQTNDIQNDFNFQLQNTMIRNETQHQINQQFILSQNSFNYNDELDLFKKKFSSLLLSYFNKLQKEQKEQISQHEQEVLQNNKIIQQQIKKLNELNESIQDLQNYLEMKNQKNEQDNLFKKQEERIPNIQITLGLCYQFFNIYNDKSIIGGDMNLSKQYKIFEIKLNESKFEQLIRESDLKNLETGLDLSYLGIIDTSYQKINNRKNELLEGQEMKITDEKNFLLKGCSIIRIQLRSNENNYSKQSALKLSLNSMVCSFLLKRYKNDLKEAQVEDNFNLKIPRQFILKDINNNDYYYAHIIEQGKTQRINGGNIDLNNEEIDQYCNAFSLYTFNSLNQKGIITFITVQNNLYLYDVIFSTIDQIVSPIDQGQLEINQFLEQFQSNPQKFSTYHSDILGIIANNKFKIN